MIFFGTGYQLQSALGVLKPLLAFTISRVVSTAIPPIFHCVNRKKKKQEKTERK
jgi:hypothetical protein